MPYGRCAMSDIYMSGTLFGDASIGIVQYEALRWFKECEPQIKSMVSDLLSGQVNELSELLNDEDNQRSFYLSHVESVDITLGPRFARACAIAYYDRNDLPQYSSGLLGLRHDESFFHSWVDMVRIEQYHVILELVMNIYQDVTGRSFNYLFELNFNDVVIEPIVNTAEYQKEVFGIASSFHHLLQISPSLYSADFSGNLPMKSNVCPFKYQQARSLYELLKQYDFTFDSYNLKDLSGLILSNSLLGVDSYQDYSNVVSKWLDHSLLMQASSLARH